MVLTSSFSILWISSIEMVAMESSLTLFTPLGLTFGILLMSSTTLSGTKRSKGKQREVKGSNCNVD